jgi:hypothetical protein
LLVVVVVEKAGMAQVVEQVVLELLQSLLLLLGVKL